MLGGQGLNETSEEMKDLRVSMVIGEMGVTFPTEEGKPQIMITNCLPSPFSPPRGRLGGIINDYKKVFRGSLSTIQGQGRNSVSASVFSPGPAGNAKFFAAPEASLALG